MTDKNEAPRGAADTNKRPQNPPKRPDTSHSNKKAPPFAALGAALAQSLVPDDKGEDMLRRQMQTLDTLFTHTIHDYTGSAEPPTGHGQTHRLGFALRVQKQCIDTVKALSAMGYLEALSMSVTPPAFRQPTEKISTLPPSPPDFYERTELGENDT